jgi:hypothetical protein
MPKGTVRASNVNLRRSPKTGVVIKGLRRSSRVEVLGEETWYRVKTSDGTVGFVLGDFVDKDLEPAPSARPAAAGEPSGDCVLTVYHHARFSGGKELIADREFFPSLDRLARFAEDCEVFIHVTSSAREPERRVSGAIVPPASRSNHLVGHAIDMNLRTASSFFNSSKLKKSKLGALPQNVRQFITLVRDDPDLRWGGDFSREDPVHIDDALNVRDRATWDAKLASRG